MDTSCKPTGVALASPGVRARRFALAGALCLLASACQLRLGLDVALDAAGGGVLELAVVLDGELRTLLEEAGFDPTLGLADLDDRAEGWESAQTETDGGLELRFVAPFPDPDGFASLTGRLHAALGPEDGRLFRELGVTVEDDGGVAFRGEVGLVPPEVPGATGVGVEFDEDDLRALLDERGDELVRYELRVTLPAPPAEHDADRVDGASLTWDAPVGRLRAVSARSFPPPGTDPLLVGAVAVTAAIAAGVVVLRLRARRRRRLRERPGI